MSRLNLVVVGVVMLTMMGIASFAPPVLGDGDTWWHVKAGLWILDNGHVPHLDPFATHRPALPWVMHEWLSEVLMALAFRWAGWSGVVVLTGLAAALAFALLGARLARDLEGLALACVLLLVASLMSAGFLARPHILALPVLVAWTISLLKAREQDRAPSLLLLPLMVIWANLHGGYAFGIALICPFALEALVEAKPAARWRVVWSWGVFGIASVAASVVTPHGFEGLLFPFKLLSMKSIVLIGEWQPTSFAMLQPLEVALAAVLFIVLQYRVRMPVLRVVLLLGLLHMALGQTRHQLLLGFVGALLLAEPLARAFADRRDLPKASRSARAGWPDLVALMAGLAVVAGLRLALPLVRSNGPTAPIAALATVPQALRAKPVLNSYAFGGYLIWLGIAPSIDGRADMYGDEGMFANDRLLSADPAVLDAALARIDAQWTVLAPQEPLVALLDTKPGWRRLYGDAFAVLHERVPGG
ncbi:hypothetical protein LJR009_000153 [Bosea sp. LjRoot9]|uniref:hypothetical protein n=1 Tax=Bosea sp. LjRoot9 TaxID=3342341 RepID=UPI003ECE24DE